MIDNNEQSHDELDDDELEEGIIVYDIISDTPDYSYPADIKDDEASKL
jgi:hypothetical protein